MSDVKPTPAERLRAMRERAVANGLCYQCRCRPKTETARYCAHCLQRTAEIKRAIEGRNIAAGLCRCGRERADGFDTCARHRDQYRANAARRTKERDDAGLCRRCPEQAEPGRRCCRVCLDHMSNTNSIRRFDLIERGICGSFGCGRKLKVGHSMCSWCLKDMRDTGSPHPSWRRRAA